MQRLVTVLFGFLFICSFVMSQETDSLLLADFENDELGLNGWGAWGDACEEVMVSADPDGEANYTIESILDCAREGEKKGGFSKSDLSIVVDGDTATALVIYVWIPEDMPAELNGYQIFSMDHYSILNSFNVRFKSFVYSFVTTSAVKFIVYSSS